ncbi:MAG: hypothetical protein WHU94_10510 [Thermogemmata sp.]
MLALLVPDGVGVRNFIHGRFLEEAQRVFRVWILTGFPPQDLPDAPDGVEIEGMAPYREGKTGLLLRYALQYAHMCRWNTVGMRRVLGEPRHHSLKAMVLHKAAKAIGKAHANASGIRRLEGQLWGWVSRRQETEYYRRRFRERKPAMVMCTHQRPSIALPAILAARELGIPTATFIFSWDNLSSKGRIAAPYRHFFVWSNWMRQEMHQFYPEVEGDRVHVVGTPQFDPYADEALRWSREEFFRRIGADPERPLICYSGGDRSVCPQGPEQVASVLELIRAGKIQRRPQLLLRPVPTEDGERYRRVRENYPELIFARPEWAGKPGGGWDTFLPKRADVQFLANLVFHADLNINVSSTMTLDFAIHDKPVVNLAYDIGGEEPFGMPIFEFHYRFEHWQPVMEFGAARVARSPEELAEHVNAYLENPALDREGRRKLVELEVGVPVGRSAETLVAALEGIAARREVAA